MKRYIFILIVALSLFSVSTFAQGVKFQNITFEKALELAMKSKGEKLIFIDFYTSWCGPCKMMSEKIFPLKEVGKVMNEKFISLKIDAENGDGVTLAERYKVSSYPTMLVINDKGEEVRRVIGYKNDYTEFLGRVTGTITDEKLMEIAKANYESDNTTENALKYLEFLRKFKMTDQIKDIVEKVYFNTPVEERFSYRIWELVDDYVFSPESPIIKDVMSHKSVATSLNKLSKKSVDKKLIEVHAIYLLQALSNVVEITKEQANRYSDVVYLLETPNPIGDSRSASVIISELVKLKLDNKIDDMLTILENEVPLLASNFYRLQTEMAFAEYKNLNESQKARLVKYYNKVSAIETAKGKEAEAILEDLLKSKK